MAAVVGQKRLREFLCNPVAVVFGAVLLFFISQIIGASLATPFMHYLRSENYRLLVFIGMNLAVLYCLLMVVLQISCFDWQSLGWRKPNRKSLSYVLPAALVYFLISTIFTILASKFIPGFDVKQAQDVGFSGLHNSGELIAAFISLVILTPIFEETVFRGILFRGLRRRTPFWTAALLVSLIFAVAHLQWNVAVDVFALSLILCWLTEKSNSILPGILLHALKNSLAFLLLFVIKT